MLAKGGSAHCICLHFEANGLLPEGCVERHLLGQQAGVCPCNGHWGGQALEPKKGLSVKCDGVILFFFLRRQKFCCAVPGGAKCPLTLGRPSEQLLLRPPAQLVLATHLQVMRMLMAVCFWNEGVYVYIDL